MNRLLVPLLGLAALGLPAGLAAQTMHVEGPRLHAGPGVVAASAPSRVTTARSATARAAGAGPAEDASGYQATAYGKKVALSGDWAVIASNTTVTVDNQAGSTGDVADLLAGLGLGKVLDVAVGDGVIMVCTQFEPFGSPLGSRVTYFRFGGSTWTVEASPLDFDIERTEGVIHGDLAWEIWSDENGTTSRLEVRDLGSAGVPVVGTWNAPWARLVEVAAGDGSNSLIGQQALVCTDSGIREIESFTYKTSLVPRGVVASDATGQLFGEGLAVDDGAAWIGVPGDDTYATDAGRVELRLMASPSLMTYGGAYWSGQAFDFTGLSLAMEDDLLCFSELGADLLGSQVAGAVRLARRTGLQDWTLTGEIYAAYDQTNQVSFGQDLGLSGERMIVGASNTVFIHFVPATSVFVNGLAPGLAGLGGVVPQAQQFGHTYPGQPNSIEVWDARPSTTAFMILGLFPLGAPFKGGTLLPSPDVLVPLPTSPAGGISIPFAWPFTAGPYTLFIQFWFQDAAAVNGFSASQGWSVTQPF